MPLNLSVYIRNFVMMRKEVEGREEVRRSEKGRLQWLKASTRSQSKQIRSDLPLMEEYEIPKTLVLTAK